MRRQKATVETIENDLLVVGEIDIEEAVRVRTNVPLWDVLTDGGLPEGSVTLVGGDEGSGKSSSLLEVAFRSECERTMYATGEERAMMVAARARALGLEELNAETRRCAIFNTNHTEQIFIAADAWRPQVLIIDSQQTFASPRFKTDQGSMSQIKYLLTCARAYADRTGCRVVLVGQLTQSKKIAGPSRTRFLVDAVGIILRNEKSGVRVAKMRKSRYCATHVEVHYDIVKKDDVLFFALEWVGKAGTRRKGKKTKPQVLFDEHGVYIGPLASQVSQFADIGEDANEEDDEGDDAADEGAAAAPSVAGSKRARPSAEKEPKSSAKQKGAARGLRVLEGGGEDTEEPAKRRSKRRATPRLVGSDAEFASRGGIDGRGYDLRRGDSTHDEAGDEDAAGDEIEGDNDDGYEEFEDDAALMAMRLAQDRAEVPKRLPRMPQGSGSLLPELPPISEDDQCEPPMEPLD